MFGHGIGYHRQIGDEAVGVAPLAPGIAGFDRKPKAPLDVALATGHGADAVINLLGRAAYGGGV
jgi:hypothetical protein